MVFTTLLATKAAIAGKSASIPGFGHPVSPIGPPGLDFSGGAHSSSGCGYQPGWHGNAHGSATNSGHSEGGGTSYGGQHFGAGGSFTHSAPWGHHPGAGSWGGGIGITGCW